MSAKKRNRARLTAKKYLAAAADPTLKAICEVLKSGRDLDGEMLDYARAHQVELRRAFCVLRVSAEIVDDKVSRTTGRPPGMPPALRAAMNEALPEGQPYKRAPRRIADTGSSPDGSKIPAWSFYRTETWKRLRYRALRDSNGRCMCCGAAAIDGATLRVDHIKPISKAPHLKADPDNLQVLCNDCNWGKGSDDETDWRLGPVFELGRK